MDLSITIPAYNEGKRIKKTLLTYLDFFKKKKKSFEIIIILNGCIDNTLEIVKSIAKKYPQLKYKNFLQKLGKGGALIKGFEEAKGNLISYVDADGSTKPEALCDLILRLGDHDGVIGSRWMRGSKIIKKQPLIRRIASRAFNFLVRLILNLNYKDTQCAAKIFKSNVIKSTLNEIEVTNFAFDACLLYKLKRKGFKIIEVPTEWEDKEYSTLKIRKTAPKMFFTILKTRIKDIF